MQLDGTLVRDERTRRAWTQADLAARAGIDERTVQRLERTGQTSFSTIQAIAAAFGVQPGALIDKEPTDTIGARTRVRAPMARGRRVAYWTLLVLALLGIVRFGLEMLMFAIPNWQLGVLAAAAAIAILVYAHRLQDARLFGLLTLAALITLLWWLPLALPAAVFLLATYLVVSVRRP